MVEVGLLICEFFMLIATLYGLYQGFMAMPFTRWPGSKPLLTNTQHRFAVLIFAKNEESVIGNLLASLNEQNYPKELFEVFVTADNCTDSTAKISADLGATVWERTAPDKIGKGYALNWFFQRFSAKRAADFDAVVIFDADNIVDPGFLQAMNRKLDQGVRIAVGYRMGKNPTTSWISGTTSLYWLLQTRFVHRARARRNLSCLSVGGTGFMFSLKVLPNGQWISHSATEDIEFTLKAIAAGHHVAIATDAIFYDEQPLTLKQSITQRYRWTLGAFQAISLCIPTLWKVRKGRGQAILDPILFALGVPIAGVSTCLGMISFPLMILWTGNWLFVVLTTAGLAAFVYLGTCGVAWLVLQLERVHWKGDWKAILTFPIFLLTWSMLYVAVLFYRNPVWTTIPHVEALTLDKMTHRQQRNPLDPESTIRLGVQQPEQEA